MRESPLTRVGNRPDRRRKEQLHDVVLRETAVFSGVHSIPTTATWRKVSDEAQTELSTPVLIALELGDGRVGSLSRVEANHTCAFGAAGGLVLDLRLLNVTNGAEQLHKIFVASRPGQVADEDDLVPVAIRGGGISERVGSRWSGLRTSERGTTSAKVWATVVASRASIEAAAATTSKTAPSCKSEIAAATESATKSTSESASTAHGIGEAVDTNLEVTPVPVVAVELLDSVASII